VFSGRTFGPLHSAYVGAIAIIIKYLIYHKTVFGREVQAIGGGEKVSRLGGLKIDLIKMKMFIILGSLC
jgi:ribose transport system permease protein